MNIFETVKAAVTVRQAAEHYGLKINRSGMICCPFHDDRHPSLKLNEDYFYCFGCGAKGDVNVPMWFDGKSINEALFCEDFLRTRQIIFANGAFFTPDGRVTDDLPLRGEIFE